MSGHEVNTSTASVRGWYGLVLAALATVLVMPIWFVENPPLVDYPNHLARGYILYHYHEVSDFQTYYDVDYLSTPSLAMDLFMVATQHLCDVRTSGTLFLTLTIWLWLIGWHLLGHAIHGKPTWLALIGVLDAYHSMFFYGFTNFAFSLGVFLVSLAAWYHGRQHWRSWRYPLMAVLALACFFSHLSAFIFLAGSVLAITAWECARSRTLRWQAVVEMLPIFVPLALVRGGGQTDLEWDFPGKLIGALSLFRSYDRYLDLGYIAALGGFAVLAYRSLASARVAGSILFTGIGCVAMFLVGPSVLFGGRPADARFLPAASAMVTLSLQFCYPRGKALLLLFLFLCLAGFRLTVITQTWRELDAEIADQVAMLAELPERAKVYPIVKISPQADERKRDLASLHVVCYAVIDKQIYTPSLLAFKGHNPIHYKSPPPRITDHADPEPFPPIDRVNWEGVFGNHDYVWCYRLPEDYRKLLELRCILVSENGKHTMWQVPRRP